MLVAANSNDTDWEVGCASWAANCLRDGTGLLERHQRTGARVLAEYWADELDAPRKHTGAWCILCYGRDGGSRMRAPATCMQHVVTRPWRGGMLDLTAWESGSVRDPLHATVWQGG